MPSEPSHLPRVPVWRPPPALDTSRLETRCWDASGTLTKVCTAAHPGSTNPRAGRVRRRLATAQPRRASSERPSGTGSHGHPDPLRRGRGSPKQRSPILRCKRLKRPLQERKRGPRSSSSSSRDPRAAFDSAAGRQVGRPVGYIPLGITQLQLLSF